MRQRVVRLAVMAASAVWAASCAVDQACAASGTAPVPEIDVPHAVRAPFYGATLFAFYQDRSFDALTGLLVSQHFQRLGPHADEAEVLRGGLLLNYGLVNEAEGVFARLMAGHASPAVRDRAWYLLARSQHQRGQDAAAAKSLAQISAPLSRDLESDRRLLQAQLLIGAGDDAGAAAILDALLADPTTSPIAAAYARFNLGVALLRRGQRKSGNAQLDALGQSPAADEEMRSLRDRANLARGFAALQAGQPVEARAALQRVRLTGPASDKALLGFGWAADQLHDPQLALTPWRLLADRPGSDAAILEAKIAVPYALSELGAYGGALQGYRDALAGFTQEQQALDESVTAIRAGTLVHELLKLNPDIGDDDLGRHAAIHSVPAMPHASHLVQILARNDFQQGLRNLRDLRFLQTNLATWQQSLSSFDDMLATRQRAFADRLPAVRGQAGRTDVQALARRLAALQAEFAQAVATGDTSAFSTPRERAQQARMARDLGLLERAGDDPALAGMGERLRRVAGALTWQRALEQPARQWEVRKNLNATQVALEQAQERDAALARAQQLEPVSNQRFGSRIAALRDRVIALQPQVGLLADEQQLALEQLAVAELQRQHERLDLYAAQARLAIAQILDRGKLAEHKDGEGQR